MISMKVAKIDVLVSPSETVASMRKVLHGRHGCLVVRYLKADQANPPSPTAIIIPSMTPAGVEEWAAHSMNTV